MKNATFTLEGYRFPKATIDLTHLKKEKNEFEMNIFPSGKFKAETHEFNLRFVFTATLNKAATPSITVECEAGFVFTDTVSLEEIPDYFYPNSIAIVFPYVRAFISTLTLQANYMPLVLPTMNLSDLSETLRQHVSVE